MTNDDELMSKDVDGLKTDDNELMTIDDGRLMMAATQGREHEWMFTSSEGQRQLAAACASKRLIVVSLSRGHSFPPLPALQVGTACNEHACG